MDDNNKKQVPLRITQKLWNDLSAWASDDFRSLNGQIEYLLTECVRRRKKGSGGRPASAISEDVRAEGGEGRDDMDNGVIE